MEVNEQSTIKDILHQLKSENKAVEIQIRGGSLYKGKIAELGMFCVRLQLIGPKSFFDAVIKIEDIAAVEVRIRDS